ncbi:MAG: DUF1735 domain-containing protein [Chitinophagaceae bacterium]
MKLYMKPAIVFLLALLLVVTGCLKDKEFEDGKIQSVHTTGDQKVVELSLTATSTENYLRISMANSSNDTVFNLVPVTLASAKPATEDIKVTLIPNAALIGNYNAEHGTIHEEAPASAYTIDNPVATPGPGYVVTIPKGSYIGYLKLKIKPVNFLGHDYAFGFQISKIEPAGYLISSNLSTGVVAVGIKNKYDGVYSLRIKTIGWTNYGIADNATGDYPDDFWVVTAGANSVSLYNPTSGFADLQPAFTGTTGVPGTLGGPTGFGATTPLFVFDPVTDTLLSVSNTTPDDGRGRALSKNNNVRGSGYVAATKKIYAAYIMTQNGRPSQFIYDTLTYVGSR